MRLRRGFKTEADEYSREFRKELSLAAHAPLCPWQLANHLEIPVVQLSDLAADSPTSIRYLLSRGKDYFSAVTVFLGPRRVVLHNDGNAKSRQASDIAHELAHAILMHPPMPPFNSRGMRTVDKTLGFVPKGV